jgi:hypothetical protein
MTITNRTVYVLLTQCNISLDKLKQPSYALKIMKVAFIKNLCANEDETLTTR